MVSTYGSRIERALTSANDFHKERHRVNKKLAKLRASLSLKNKNPKNYKKAEFTIEDYEKKPGVADILLFTVERDVLYALENKAIIEVQSSRAKETFINSKYRRAIFNLKKLLALIDSLEASVKLQTYVYASIIQGSYLVFKRRWQEANYSFSLARLGVQSLLLDSKFAHREVLVELIDNVIDPAFTLSLYNLSATQSSTPNLVQISKNEATKDSISYLSPAVKLIDQTLLEKDDAEMEAIKEISWSDYTSPIRDDDTSRLLMLAEKNTNVQLVSASSYDPALLLWQNVLDHHIAEMEKKADLSDEEMQENQIILTYVSYKLNFLKIQRDLTLLEEIEAKPLNKSSIKKSLKILDTVLINLKIIKELPGVYNDEKIWKNLEIYEKYFEIAKMNKLAESYLITGKFKESLLLVNESSKLIKDIDSSLLIDGGEKKLPNGEEIAQLSQSIDQNLAKLQALTQYYSSKSSQGQYYAENLSTIPTDFTKLVNVKDFQMVHQKPVLFDIAFNYIEYQKESDTSKEKKGFFGLFGGKN